VPKAVRSPRGLSNPQWVQGLYLHPFQCLDKHTARCNEVDPYSLALCYAGFDGLYRSGQIFQISISCACNASWTNLTARRCRSIGG